MNTSNMELHSPQVGVYPAGVTQHESLTVDNILEASETDGALEVEVHTEEDLTEVVSTFEDHTRHVEITPDGVFVHVTKI